MAYENWIPMGNRAMVELDSMENRATPSGIIMTKQAQKYTEQTFLGTVKRVGPACVALKEGSRVVIPRHLGIGDGQLILVEETEILADYPPDFEPHVSL